MSNPFHSSCPGNRGRQAKLFVQYIDQESRNSLLDGCSTLNTQTTENMTNSTDRSIMQGLAARLDKDPGIPVQNATESYWQVPQLSLANHQSDSLPAEGDVVIIGSGIAAISTALHLFRHDPALRIVMLEARSAISGATGRNGGHIKAVPWTDYSALKTELGKESAMKITKFRLAHLDALVNEAAALWEAGKAGLVRRVKGVSAVYDREAWSFAKVKLEAFLEDFPEERGRWTAYEGEHEMEVCANPGGWGLRVADIFSEMGPRQRVRLYHGAVGGSLAIPTAGWHLISNAGRWATLT